MKINRPQSGATFRCTLLFGYSALLAAASLSAAVEYRAIYLGHFQNISPGGMNNFGQLALKSYNYTDARYRPSITTPGNGSRELGLLWNSGGTRAWTGPAEGYSGAAWAVNDSGVVVGTAASGTGVSSSNYQSSAFRTQSGRAIALDTPAAGALGMTTVTGVAAWGVNSTGVTVGSASGTGTRSYAPLSWDASGTPAVLPTPTGAQVDSETLDINDSGAIVGYAKSGTFYHAAVWQNGICTDLGTLGGSNSVAYGINNSGWLVGFAENASGHDRAFRKGPDSQALEDLGTLGGGLTSIAYDINAQGTIVGASYGAGFVWDGTHGMRKLADLDDLNVTYTAAYSINDRGFIVALSGSSYYLLRPVGTVGRWHPINASVGWDSPRVLWYDDTSTSIAAWRCSTTGNYVSSGIQTFIPDPSYWSLVDFKATTNSMCYALWNGIGSNANKYALWILDAAGNLTSGSEFPLPAGWQTLLAATDPVSASLRLLHYRVSDSTYAVWTCDAAGNFLAGTQLSAGAEWTPVGMTTGSDSKTWILWNNPAGGTALWRLNSAGGLEVGSDLGANAEWIPTHLTMAGTEPYIWWTRKADGAVAFWHCNGNGQFASGGTINPPAGWGLYDVSTNWSTGGQTLFWLNFNNETAVWNVDSAGQYISGSATGMIGAN